MAAFIFFKIFLQEILRGTIYRQGSLLLLGAAMGQNQNRQTRPMADNLLIFA